MLRKRAMSASRKMQVWKWVSEKARSLVQVSSKRAAMRVVGWEDGGGRSGVVGWMRRRVLCCDSRVRARREEAGREGVVRTMRG